MAEDEIPFKEKIKSINFGSDRVPKTFIDGDGNKRTQHILDTTGEVNGWTTEHPSGRQDAQIFVDAPALSAEIPALKPTVTEDQFRAPRNPMNLPFN